MNHDESRYPNVHAGSLISAVPSSSVLYLESVTPPADPGNPNKKTFVDHVHLVLSRKLLLIAFVIVGLGAAIAITLLEEPTYQAEATLEVRTLRTGASLISVGDTQMDQADTASWLETQIRILQSGALAERVRARLRLEHPNRVYQMQDVFADWRRLLRLPPKKRGVGTAEPPPVKTKVVGLGGSSILQITCESWDPELTSEYANALANEYIQFNLENFGDSVNRISVWLARQVRDARDQLERSENQLQNYTRQANLVYTGETQEDSAEHKKLRQLQDDLAKASADRMVKQATYELAKSAPAGTMPDASSGQMANYQAKLADLKLELNELRLVYTDAQPKVRAVLAQIQELDAAIQEERADILERSRNAYEQARSIERMLSAAYTAQVPRASETSRKGIQYGLMKWDVDTNRHVYDELLQRVKAITIGSTLQANNSSILDRAKTPKAPYLPDVTRNVLAGAGSGLGFGLLMIFVGEFVNRNLKAPGESAFHLGVPELGVIPSRDYRVTNVPSNRFPKLLATPADEGDTGRVELVTWEDRPSIMAEAYRNTLASILLSSSGSGRHQVILVTSPGRGEGKSSTVSNLGIALAEINQRVILIDADLRKPSLHTIFTVANSWGLSDVLHEKMSLKDSPLEALARATSIEGLYLLPSGPGTTSIANLFYSERMSDLVDRLRREFDTIIIDTPPISYLADARFVGRVVDSAVLVLRAGITTRDAAIVAKQRLKDDGIPLLGTVLNAWDGRAKSRYGDPNAGYAYPYTEPVDPLA